MTPTTSSSTSGQYIRRLTRIQTSIGSQETNNDPEPIQEPESPSTGSLEGFYLVTDHQYDSQDPITTPPPIASPPSDASYDESFIEMVKQTVRRARIAFATRQEEETDSISHYLNSQASVLLSSQGSNEEKDDDDDEARVEQARRAVDPQLDDPPFFKQESSQKSIDTLTSLPEFAVIKKNPCTIQEVDYVTNKKPEKEEAEIIARATADARLYFERERDLYKEVINELKQQHQEQEEDSSKDYSSWLCFDNENEVAQFKDRIYNEDSHIHVPVNEFMPNVNSDDDAISPITNQPFWPTRRSSSPPHQKEQGQAVRSQQIQENESSLLGNFRDTIVMQSTPIVQRRFIPKLSMNKRSNQSNKMTGVAGLLFGSDQEVEERRAAVFDREKEPNSPPRQPFFNLRKNI